MKPIDLRDTTITIRDGGSNFIEIEIGEGNLNWSNRRNIDVVKSRGLLDTIREGDEEPVDVNFQFLWISITGSSGDPPSIEDALYRIGEAAAWVSTNADSHAPYSVNIVIENIPPCEGVEKETIILEWFNHADLSHSLKDGTIDCKGICNITKPIVTRG